MILKVLENKKVTALLIFVLILLLTSACTPQEVTVEPEDELPVFTLEELAEYDGQDGRPAYVAVDGIVYDVTNNEMWEDGTHPGGHMASEELSAEILESPHGPSVLEVLEVVGSIE